MSAPFDNRNVSKDSASDQVLADQRLLDQALVLCRQLHEHPDDALLQDQVRRWQQQSPRHQEYWQRAQMYWQASGKIRPQFNETGFFNRLSLWLQVASERVQDRARESGSVISSLVRNICHGDHRYIAAAWVLVSCVLTVTLFVTGYGSRVVDQAVSPPGVVESTTARYQTGWRQQHQIALADGSVIQLNWNTEITVTLNEHQRLVSLHKGEAFFTVASDKSRPFIVEVQGVSATAVGTAFSVRHDQQRQAIITVSEGIVEVASPVIEPVRLSLNQQVSSSVVHRSEIMVVNADNAMAWQQGLLIFQAQPLKDVLNELNRYTGFTIKPGLIHEPHRPVTGTYFTERADDALGLIALAFDLELKRSAKASTVIVNSRRLSRPE